MFDFAKLQAAFDENFASRGECGAAISLWKDGDEIFHACAGAAKSVRGRAGLTESQSWDSDTLVPIFSATKLASSACLLNALYAQGLSEAMAVGEIWPRFPAPKVTVAQILSHQVGLAALARPANVFDLDDCQAAIEETKPAWLPPKHGYHPHTFGPIIDILMRALTGERVCEYWEEVVRKPLSLDFFLDLPDTEHERVAELRSPRMQGRMPSDDFYRAYFTEDSLTYRAFRSIVGLDGARDMNTAKGLHCGCPAKGGVASARGLAHFYQLLLGCGERQIFAPEVVTLLASPQTAGYDEILMQDTSFSCGAMLAPIELFTCQSLQGFGHAGAGGCHAFCIPEAKLSFAYVMNQMDFGVLPGEKLHSLLAALK